MHLIHRKRSPFPEERVESEEWRVEMAAASEARFTMSSVCDHLDHIHRKRSPFPS